MIINHNIAALNTHRQLGSNNVAASKNLEKLSSGLKINRAGDDAAGLAISEKMRGQIRGLDMASKNSQDSISLIQTAEGALNETHSILQRMRELAVQSANDTNTGGDRGEIQKEMDQLGKEIDRISQTTQFNTKNLLDGSMGKGVDAAVANVNTNKAIGGAVTVISGTADTGSVGSGNFVPGTPDTTTTADLAAGTNLADLTDANGNKLGIKAGDTISITYVQGGETKTANVSGGQTLGDLVTAIGGSGTYGAGSLDLKSAAAGFEDAVNGLTITVTDSKGDVRTSATNALSSFSETTVAENARADGQATFHIGANTNQSIQLSIENMGASALGVQDLKVGNQGQANVAMKVLDDALAKVSSERSKLGATQNRLEHTINNLNTSSENLTAAESRIRDVDMAKEMMSFTKNNILTQAAQAMLAQSNQMPQGVLQLLR
ncbi:flagellin [Sporosarcina sp. resist]|uniref:flagellin N-terminal helical domain-containing protein n=1 Tax=Sporosarcina sp. resist TaxID=2762563 RepID=UPI00164DE4AE|nr:flagellin [Sporosarcina sp. resist]QNK87248.1 flagellin [Sporosarcina sp. resist]